MLHFEPCLPNIPQINFTKRVGFGAVFLHAFHFANPNTFDHNEVSLSPSEIKIN